jgi:hypothetical protein
MNKQDLQQKMRANEKENTLQANNWISSVGLDAYTFGTTHIKLLQAQQQASQLLKHHSHLLTNSQRKTLEDFKHQMSHKNTRIKLKPAAAFPVFNISTKINRQLFKQHRQLTKKTQ